MGQVSLKNILLLLIFILLFLPMLQDKFEFVSIKPLNGAIMYPEKDSLTAKNWFSGQYQQQQELYLNDMFGLRNACVRLNNQIFYSLTNKAGAKGVIVGKENYLYEESYINSYMGRDFIGEDSVKKLIKRLKFVSDTLAKLNKQLILVFAAGKASYYPEFIPDNYTRFNKNTNYKALSQAAKAAHVNVIDFNAWFMLNKEKSEYPLYPQYGIHWSNYGSVLVADSIIKVVEQLRGIDMPDLYYTNLRMQEAHGLDYDIGDGMNIITKLKSFDMAYVDVKFENDSGKTKPNVLVISDSFYWGIYDFGFTKAFNEEQFWFYNKQVFPRSFKEETVTDYLDLRKEIETKDVIIIMATEANLQRPGWGFLEAAEDIFRSQAAPHSARYFERLKSVADYIRHDEHWYKSVVEKATAENNDIDVQIVKEAKAAVQKEGVY